MGILKLVYVVVLQQNISCKKNEILNADWDQLQFYLWCG
jgi:hypothetical protein